MLANEIRQLAGPQRRLPPVALGPLATTRLARTIHTAPASLAPLVIARPPGLPLRVAFTRCDPVSVIAQARAAS